MIHFLRYPKGLGGTETKVRKCSNSNCPQLALTSRLHRCQFWNSWDDQQAASGARPTVQDHDWAAGCSSWWPLSSNPPCRATLGVALGSVTREALPCNMFPDWRGGHCAHTRMPPLFALYTFRRKERFLMHLLCCEQPSTSTFLKNVHCTSCKNQGRFTAYKSLESALACDSCPRKRKRRGGIFVYRKTSFPEFVLQSKSKFHDAFKVLCGYIINLVRHCLYHYKVTSFPFHLLCGREQTLYFVEQSSSSKCVSASLSAVCKSLTL